MKPLTSCAAALCVAGGLLAGAGSAHEVATPEHEFVGVEKCANCHDKELYGDQVAAWRKGPHAHAFESLASDKAREYATAAGIEGPAQQADACLRCHVTAHGVDLDWIRYDLEPEDGVQCESCHGPGQDYREREIMADEAKAREAGLAEQTLAVCSRCHNDKSPAWDPERYTLADGTRVGFDFAQATAKIAHPTPPDRKGHIIELEDAQKKQRKQRSIR